MYNKGVSHWDSISENSLLQSLPSDNHINIKVPARKAEAKGGGKRDDFVKVEYRNNNTSVITTAFGKYQLNECVTREHQHQLPEHRAIINKFAPVSQINLVLCIYIVQDWLLAAVAALLLCRDVVVVAGIRRRNSYSSLTYAKPARFEDDPKSNIKNGRINTKNHHHHRIR